MARWSVEYKSPRGDKDSTVVEVPDEFKTAKEVVSALESGRVPDAYFAAGAIIAVIRFDPPPSSFEVVRG
ncbi:MAG: hypothetical protein ABSG61_15225 [Gemmatimonadales bacterium]|jgi:hypothetical protein